MKNEETTKKQPFRKIAGIHKIENSDVMKHTLTSLVHVASTKTSEDYARTSLKKLLKELEDNYYFLKYIEIEDAESLEDTYEAITVMSRIDRVEPRTVGKAIQSLIDVLKKYLGKKAGFFFIQEFRDDLGDDYHSVIKNMGVDLRLADLQEELGGWDIEQYKIKDDSDTNIAFIEKNKD